MRLLILAAAVVGVAMPCGAAAATFTPDDEARITSLSSPVFAPDGARMALVRTVQDTKADKSHTALVTVDVAGGAMHVLTEKVEGIAQPTYSPDGKQIAFLAFDKKHQRQIELTPAAGGAARDHEGEVRRAAVRVAAQRSRARLHHAGRSAGAHRAAP